VMMVMVSAFALPTSVCMYRDRVLGHSVVPRWSSQHGVESEAVRSEAEW
jgi:hypothetical protein